MVSPGLDCVDLPGINTSMSIKLGSRHQGYMDFHRRVFYRHSERADYDTAVEMVAGGVGRFRAGMGSGRRYAAYDVIDDAPYERNRRDLDGALRGLRADFSGAYD